MLNRSLTTLIIFFLSFPGLGHATDIVVTEIFDEEEADGDCSLREAIMAANEDRVVDACPAGAGRDVIVLAQKTYVIGDHIEVRDQLELRGVAAGATVIQATQTDGILVLFRESQEVDVRDLTLRGGEGAAGGALYMHVGTRADFEGVVFSRNKAVVSSVAGSGGAILNLGDLTLRNCVLHENEALGDSKRGGRGGAIFNGASAQLRVYQSTLSGNAVTGDPGDGGDVDGLGGAIFDDGGWVTLDFVTVTGNRAFGGPGGNSEDSGRGGGIFSSLGTVEVRGSIVSQNHAGDGADCGGIGASVDSLGFNVLGDGCSAEGTDTATTSAGLLQRNDTAVLPFHALTSSSAAFDGAEDCRDSDGLIVSLDQRGLPRPAPSGGACDIGAVEAQVSDGDRFFDDEDNCPAVSNPDQSDRDGDGQGDACDSCPDLPNQPEQDTDGDGLPDACDVCPLVSSMDQRDADGDGVGDLCDNCPVTPNPDQVDRNTNGVGDACALDADNDGLEDAEDNCPRNANPAQADEDGDGRGDACDDPPPPPDTDGDGVPDTSDNCPRVENPAQADEDGDGFGDVCDRPPMVLAEDGGCRGTGRPTSTGLWLVLLGVVVLRRATAFNSR